MARRKSIMEALAETAPEPEQVPGARTAGAPTAEAPAAEPEPASKPRARGTRKPRGEAQAGAAPSSGSRSRPGRRAASPTKGSEKAPSKPAAKPAEPPRVLAPESGADAAKVMLYLHPDDARALGLAKLDDKADNNARVRAMIALWRSNPRFREAVDKLARTAPRPGVYGRR